MMLQFRVMSMFLAEDAGPYSLTETKEVTCLALERAPNGKPSGGGTVTVQLKDEDVSKYKLGQMVTFMSIAPGEQDEPDYEFQPPQKRRTVTAAQFQLPPPADPEVSTHA